MPIVDEDAENVKNCIVEMGGRLEDIETHSDVDSGSLKRLFQGLNATIYTNW